MSSVKALLSVLVNAGNSYCSNSQYSSAGLVKRHANVLYVMVLPTRELHKGFRCLIPFNELFEIRLIAYFSEAVRRG